MWNFDGYRFFKHLTENILTDGHYLSPCTCKCCNAFKIFERLKFDGLAGKFPLSNFCTIWYLLLSTTQLPITSYMLRDTSNSIKEEHDMLLIMSRSNA